MSNHLFIPLTPGFSRVGNGVNEQSRFNGLPAAGKPLKRLFLLSVVCTGLKPGVNENGVTHFCQTL
jgi:hypothetical protein